jgi:hypothetical protein
MIRYGELHTRSVAQQLFVYRDLWAWPNQPFHPPIALNGPQNDFADHRIAHVTALWTAAQAKGGRLPRKAINTLAHSKLSWLSRIAHHQLVPAPHGEGRGGLRLWAPASAHPVCWVPSRILSRKARSGVVPAIAKPSQALGLAGWATNQLERLTFSSSGQLSCIEASNIHSGIVLHQEGDL